MVLWSLVTLSEVASADVRLPAIVGDHMILQQQTRAPVWGWADPGETVTVEGNWGEKATATTADNGKWKVFLKTPSHGGPHNLKINGKNEITINNVVIGEVWLCAGQSNMGWRLSAVFEGAEDAASANYPNFRIFRSERKHSHEPQEDCIAKWTPCTPDSAATCSAVSFYFARKLHQELGIPMSESKKIIDSYFERYSGIKQFIDETLVFARKEKYVQTMLGRRRYCHDIEDSNQRIRSASERATINMPIQGTAADIMKLAMIRVQNRLDAEGLRTKMLLQVHDELVFETPKEEMDALKDLVFDEMPAAMDLDVTLKVDTKWGLTWGDME